MHAIRIAATALALATMQLSSASAGPADPVSFALPYCARHAAFETYARKGWFDFFAMFDAVEMACARHVPAYSLLHTPKAARILITQVVYDVRYEARKP